MANRNSDAPKDKKAPGDAVCNDPGGKSSRRRFLINSAGTAVAVTLPVSAFTGVTRT